MRCFLPWHSLPSAIRPTSPSSVTVPPSPVTSPGLEGLMCHLDSRLVLPVAVTILIAYSFVSLALWRSQDHVPWAPVPPGMPSQSGFRGHLLAWVEVQMRSRMTSPRVWDGAVMDRSILEGQAAVCVVGTVTALALGHLNSEATVLPERAWVSTANHDKVPTARN